jgi:hypothetical protein
MFDFAGIAEGIQVEIEGLKSVAADMHLELDKGLRTQVPHINSAMSTGASVGGSIHDPAWVSLQDKYQESLRATTDAVTNLDLGTAAMAKAAQDIATMYGDADAFAKAKVDDVDKILSRAPSTS